MTSAPPQAKEPLLPERALAEPGLDFGSASAVASPPALPAPSSDACTADLVLLTSDQLRLQARWHPRAPEHPSPTATVVFAHGFSATQEHGDVVSLTRALRGDGLDVMTYDSRGHGGSEGLCEVGGAEHLDVASAVATAALVSDRVAPVVLVGVSMGAVAVSRYLASSQLPASIAGAVLVSTPARWRMRPSAVGVISALLTKTALGRQAARKWLQVRIAPRWETGETVASALRRVDLPIAVVHGAGVRQVSSAPGRIRPGCPHHG